MSERHPLSYRFHELLQELGALHDTKQADYGLNDDPFFNVRASEEWGVPAWVGAMIRLSDKVQRLKALVRNGNLRNEPAADSFRDIAVYSLIAEVLYEEAQEKEAVFQDLYRSLTEPAPSVDDVIASQTDEDELEQTQPVDLNGAEQDLVQELGDLNQVAEPLYDAADRRVEKLQDSDKEAVTWSP